jgi:hypothetical protein
MSGKPYRLRIETASIDPYRRSRIQIPAGEVIQISTFRPKHRRLVDIVWNGLTLAMFIEDIERCCEEVAEQ